MFYKSNCSSIYELQDSKIRITITCIHSKIYDRAYRYVLAIEYVTVYVNKMSPYSTVITQ